MLDDGRLQTALDQGDLPGELVKSQGLYPARGQVDEEARHDHLQAVGAAVLHDERFRGNLAHAVRRHRLQGGRLGDRAVPDLRGDPVDGRGAGDEDPGLLLAAQFPNSLQDVQGRHDVGVQSVCRLLVRHAVECLGGKVEHVVWLDVLDDAKRAPRVRELRDDHGDVAGEGGDVAERAACPHDAVDLVAALDERLGDVAAEHPRDAGDHGLLPPAPHRLQAR
mmetsp:Transcript_1786/g.4562  ORF Transcript_1786/g.4562 Transcript_1786/m.4562 type:complete len:222 (+) Transcript_1786:524-1189(+)